MHADIPHEVFRQFLAKSDISYYSFIIMAWILIRTLTDYNHNSNMQCQHAWDDPACVTCCLTTTKSKSKRDERILQIRIFSTLSDYLSCFCSHITRVMKVVEWRQKKELSQLCKPGQSLHDVALVEERYENCQEAALPFWCGKCVEVLLVTCW